ncbi:hypothetical protein [Ottowia sp. SB7-C50]|jgi:hypothetical protein|uniref:hypothetical protein n=1 Tax=Ottowia sp. SB7-C50 TaxID=3081231 RepID=UPI002952A6B0|nr:hypothetical protein [Ottowia sp. SB7-C50]WOP14037.1 hypothetical protein R0D99_08950 [Ottowia sp. SB7-C50]
MTRWFKLDGLGAWYARLSGHKSEHARVEDIRFAMLDLLGDIGASQYPHVARRIRMGADALDLWYARADLMAALAGLHGEKKARKRMAALSELFDGMLPKGMASRSTSLRL